MRQYASTHLDPGEVPVVRMTGREGVSIGVADSHGFLFGDPSVLRSFCASIIAQLDALEGEDAA